MREESPEKFRSRFINKGRYVMSGIEAFFKRSCKNVLQSMEILVHPRFGCAAHVSRLAG